MDLREAELLLTLAAESRANSLMLKELTEQMATVREVMQELSSAVSGMDEDVTRLLAENQRLLEKLASGDVPLAADVQAEVDAMLAKMQNMNAAMDAQVPVATDPSTGNSEPAPAPVATDPSTGQPVVPTESTPPAPDAEMAGRPPLTEPSATTPAGEPITQANESNT